MGWNGSGTFNRIYSWVADKNAGLDISSSRMDTDTNDIASNGFGNCLTRDGQGSATANLPMNNFRHTGVGDGVNRTDYASLNQLQNGAVNWGAAGGSADAITVTLSPAVTSLVDGQLIGIRATLPNATTSPTLKVNALSAMNITKRGGAAVLSADIPGANSEIIFRYRAASKTMDIVNPGRVGAINPTGTTTGSSGTYTYTPTNSTFPNAYVAGETYTFKADKDSAGSDVININALGNKNLKKFTSAGKVAIAAGDIKLGMFVQCMYDGTDMIVLNPRCVTDVSPTTWTPADASGASLSLTNNGSYYYQSGKMVGLSLDVTYPNTANGSNALVGGVPVNGNSNIANIVFNAPAAIVGTNISNAAIINNSTTSQIEFLSTGGGAVFTNAQISTLRIRATIPYFTS